MDLLRSLPIGLYLEQPITWLHRLDPRVKLAWLMSILVTPILADAQWRFALVGLLLGLTLAARIPYRVWRQQLGWLALLSIAVMLLTFVMPDGLEVSQPARMPTPEAIANLDPPPEVLPDLPQPTGYRYVVFDWRFITVTQRSLDLGIRVGTLLFTLIYGTNLYLLTTAPEEITLALESLMAPCAGFACPSQKLP